MFLHLGNNYMVSKDKVIAILDMETTSSSPISKDFLNDVLTNNQVYNICDGGKEKSLIITNEGLYLSPISSLTLLKRSNSVVQI
jgi:regulator of extracellular matrix RemA (YlzA/DUF370 family)